VGSSSRRHLVVPASREHSCLAAASWDVDVTSPASRISKPPVVCEQRPTNSLSHCWACRSRVLDMPALAVCCSTLLELGGQQRNGRLAAALRAARPSGAILRPRQRAACKALPDDEQATTSQPWNAVQQAQRRAAQLASRAPGVLLGLGAVTGGGILGARRRTPVRLQVLA
jgi:hypothetical protein